MAFMINDECISCGACEPECPANAIREGDDKYIIDPEKCIQCIDLFDEEQCATVCPTDACVEDPEHKETKEDLLAKKAKLGL